MRVPLPARSTASSWQTGRVPEATPVEHPQRVTSSVDGELVELRDARRIVVRRIRADDKDEFVRSFERLSPESRYRRFLHPMARLSDEDLVYLTEIDHHDHEALVALDADTGAGVGVARFVRAEDPAVAEVAVTVTDDWQGLGVGTVLLERLVDRARQEGVSRFCALIQADNRRSLELMETIGEVTSLPDGADAVLAIELPPHEGIGSPLATALHEAAASSITARGLFDTMRNRARVLHERARQSHTKEDGDAPQP